MKDEKWNSIVNSSTKELQLKRCVAYCLFNDFATCGIEQFTEDAEMHFSKAIDKIYIKNCPYIYFSCKISEESCKTFEPDNKVPELLNLSLENYDNRDVLECKTLFECYTKNFVYDFEFSPRYDLNRESGTCWFSVVSDILLNIPELDNELLERFDIKKNKKNLLGSFINSKYGTHIFNVYTRRIISRNHNVTLAPDSKKYVMKPSNYGYPEELMACIRIETGLEMLKSTTYKHYKKARDLLNLIVSISNGDMIGIVSVEVNNLWNRLEYYARRIDRFRGSILTGFKKGCIVGHAISICKTPLNTLEVFDKGKLVKKEYLCKFLKEFNQYVTLTMYEYPV
tara:strand:+ start:1914 stop:2933 length:1020 start_codon:yes stop_codon:yes gene_type:complete